jgi:hypothetical protein
MNDEFLMTKQSEVPQLAYQNIKNPTSEMLKFIDDGVGFMVLPGLYYGDRRIKAVQLNDGYFYISADEADLRKEIGGNCVWDLSYPADLAALGLSIRPELVPVRVQPLNDGGVQVKRTDGRGQSASAYQAKHPLWRKLLYSAYGERRWGLDFWMLLLPLFPLFIYFIGRLERKNRQIASFVFFIGLMLLVLFISELIKQYGWPERLSLALLVTLTGWIFINGFPFLMAFSGISTPTVEDRHVE